MPSLASTGSPALTFLCVWACTAPLAARELEGSVSVVGNVVQVQVNYDDRTPATGAKICVVDARQQVVATGHINAEGRWAHDLTQAGSYEVRIDAGSGDSDKAEMPFSISPNSLPAPAPPVNGQAPCCQPLSRGAARPVESSRPSWLPWLMVFGFIGGLGVVFWVSRSHVRGSTPPSPTPESPPRLPAEPQP